MAEYIEREAAFNAVLKLVPKVDDDGYCWVIRGDAATAIDSIPAADVRPVPSGGIGEMSDGYHTFNGLYYQRMVLFAALVNAHNDKAWKSWKHEDGKPCFDGGWFIVGIDTPQGSYTYHYEDKYWNWFECEELPAAKHWDGHTEEDVTRLLSLDVRPVVRGEWMPDYDCKAWYSEDEVAVKPSNADRIRAMTDEELATFIIVGCQGRECPSYSLLSNTEEEAAEHCWRCWLDWLKQEASE